MPVQGLDHVNIVAGDLEAVARFYVEVLGLTRRDTPGGVPPNEGQWLCDASGRAVVHLGAASRPSNAGRPMGGPTGALHHVAFACTGYQEMLARLERLGIPHRTVGVPGIGFRQIFLTDPCDIVLELNFAD
jgi:catechol 2,3-dioxygenase-like lactoylglutathione lyase family enzyme